MNTMEVLKEMGFVVINTKKDNKFYVEFNECYAFITVDENNNVIKVADHE